MKFDISSSSSVLFLATSVLSPQSYFLVSNAHWLPSVIGTWIRNRSQRHEEHHTLALEVGETSLISANLPTCIPADTRPCKYTHTIEKLFLGSWHIHKHASIDPTHAHHTVTQHHCHGYLSVRSGV